MLWRDTPQLYKERAYGRAEVLMDGNHTIDKCYDVTSKVLVEVYKIKQIMLILKEQYLSQT